MKQHGTDAFERLPVGQHCHLHWTDVTRYVTLCDLLEHYVLPWGFELFDTRVT